MFGFSQNFSNSWTVPACTAFGYGSTTTDETGSLRSGLIQHPPRSNHDFKKHRVESTRLLLLLDDRRETMWTGLMRKISITFFRFAVEKCRSARREQCFGITLQFDWD
jgi:hypothetical protein